MSPLWKANFDFSPFCDGLKASRNSSLPLIYPPTVPSTPHYQLPAPLLSIHLHDHPIGPIRQF